VQRLGNETERRERKRESESVVVCTCDLGHSMNDKKSFFLCDTNLKFRKKKVKTKKKEECVFFSFNFLDAQGPSRFKFVGKCYG